ncbi:MAG TPA: hypothetical protein VGV12_00040 [Gemmatimonadales bacterium]|nr:hypothetical protein [Gemmatimonadales bacterium]
MRPCALLILLSGPALMLGRTLAAQAVERSDAPERGVLRVTFDPRVMTWNDEFTPTGRKRLGAGLTGDTVGGRYIPAVAHMEQNVRVASGLTGFLASLGQGLLSVRQERREYPFKAELGLTNRLSVSLMVPIVRVATRTSFQLSTNGANLGLNPRLLTGASANAVFLAQFDTALAHCASSPSCAAQSSAGQWSAIRDALRAVATAPFMPLDSSAAGKAIDSTVVRIQRALDSLGVTSFDSAFTLPSDGLTGTHVEQAILDNTGIGFGYAGLPFRSSFRYGLGDVELAAKYRFAKGAHYAAAAQALARLPTGARDSADDLLRQSIGDHQLDLEGQLTQELVAGPLWLNVAVRAGVQRPGTRIQRVAPIDALLVPASATANLRWDPGDYLAVDVAPLVNFSHEFAAGFTAGYFSKARDHYAYQSAQDSVDLATRTGFPTAASVLDAGTSQRWVRLGFAVTYHAPTVEGGFSIEQTVSGAGIVPAATVYRIVFRTSRKLF